MKVSRSKNMIFISYFLCMIALASYHMKRVLKAAVTVTCWERSQLKTAELDFQSPNVISLQNLRYMSGVFIGLCNVFACRRLTI